MQKNILIAGIFAILVLPSTVKSIAQHTGNANFQDPPDFISRSFKENPFNPNSREALVTQIKTRVIRHFLKFYKDAQNVHWFKNAYGYVALFSAEGISTRVYYNNKGNYHYTIRTYDEFHLPKEIRNQVKREYSDFSISIVNEISNDQEKNAYIINIEDKTSIKVLTLFDGEMIVSEEFTKQ